MKIKSQEINLQKVGMKRRKKEVLHMKIMTGLMVVFLTVTLLFQDNMNQYQMEMNYCHYGAWLIREPVSANLQNPYLEEGGEIWSGGTIYQGGEGETREMITLSPDNTEGCSGKILGTLDTDMVQTGKLQLYEGKFPEKKDEITMEYSVLQTLGLDYELGQKITFYVPEKESTADMIINNEKLKLHRMTFTLVGTIKSYASFWNEGEVLPNAVISREKFEEISMEKQGFRFLKLKEAYENENVSSFALKLAESIKKRVANQGSWEEAGYAINTFAYENSFWSNPVMYRNMTWILVVLGISIMSYLMSSYLSKRKKYFYRLREIGATIAQVWSMAAYECIYSVVFTVAGTLAFSYGISILVVFAVAESVQIPFFYVFKWETLCKILICIILVLIVAMFCALVLLKDRRITENSNRISKLAAKRIRRRAGKKKWNVREMEKRYWISHPISMIFARVIGIGVCVCVMACLMQINEKVCSYQTISNEMKDFYINTPEIKMRNISEEVPVKSSYIDEEGNRRDTIHIGRSESYHAMNEVIPDRVFQVLGELNGIKTMQCSTRDQTHTFEWRGKGESEYYKKYHNIQTAYTVDNEKLEMDDSDDRSKKMLAELDSWLYEGRYFQDCASVWKDLKPYLDGTKADYKAFCSGKQVILMESTVEMAQEVKNNQSNMDATLQPGDNLTICTNGKDVQVEVAAVLSSDEMINYRFGKGPYSIVGSEKLGRKIAGEDGSKYGYNHIDITFNALSGSETTDKLIARQCVQNNLEYDSDAETIRAAFEKIFQAALTYGTLGVIISVLYLFILFCVLQEEQSKKEKKFMALHHLGISLKEINKIRWKNGLVEVLYMFLSVPVLYFVWYLKVQPEYSEDIVSMYSHFFGRTIYFKTKWDYIIYSILDEVNIFWVVSYLLFMAVFIIGVHVKTGCFQKKELTEKR